MCHHQDQHGCNHHGNQSKRWTRRGGGGDFPRPAYHDRHRRCVYCDVATADRSTKQELT
jgi:hypothetical protein